MGDEPERDACRHPPVRKEVGGIRTGSGSGKGRKWEEKGQEVGGGETEKIRTRP